MTFSPVKAGAVMMRTRISCMSLNISEMFKLMHEMRVRIMTAPAFTGEKVIAAILFEATMDGQAQGLPVPTYLWEKRGVVPFLKVDKGIESEANGVNLMKPVPGL